MDEIRKREKQRKSRARKDQKEKIKADVAAAVELAPLVASFGQSFRNDFPPLSLDDFEALGNATPLPSSSPPSIVERSSFSNLTRPGFAAGHDSPGLKNGLTSTQNNSIEVRETTLGYPHSRAQHQEHHQALRLSKGPGREGRSRPECPNQ